jgi:class 3 adenylate cyclase
VIDVIELGPGGGYASAMAELPLGTVTFAFTDIEGSTSLLKRLGAGYAVVLSTHRRLAREAFAACSGVEIDTQGDAFFAAFPRARDAVEAATRVQQMHAEQVWPVESSVRVRIGLHTGEPTLSDEGYLGLDVVRAARLCGSAVGGQVLMSHVTKALVGSSLPDGVGVQLLGERELKDIDEPEIVYELTIPGVTVTSARPAPSGARTAQLSVPSAPAPALPSPLPPRKVRSGKRKPTDDVGSRFDARMEDWGVRLERAIEAQIWSSLEKSQPDAGADKPRADKDAGDPKNIGATVAGFTRELDSQLATLFAEIQSDERSRGVDADAEH